MLGAIILYLGRFNLYHNKNDILSNKIFCYKITCSTKAKFWKQILTVAQQSSCYWYNPFNSGNCTIYYKINSETLLYDTSAILTSKNSRSVNSHQLNTNNTNLKNQGLREHSSCKEKQGSQIICTWNMPHHWKKKGSFK